ncbi:MAG TPA: c-type cytochrome [Thermoanaerobaculia bacterium]|nr:c-type cytochrome [Thermoanaerobaculia bacterium]
MRRLFVIVVCCVALLGCRGERGASPAERQMLPAGDPIAGKEVFVKMHCGDCHEIYGSDLPPPTIDPPVPAYLGGNQLAAPDEGYLVTAILDPSHEIAPGWMEELMTTPEGASRMPEYGDAMTARELVDLVAFLRSRYGPDAPAAPPSPEP